MEIKLLPGEQGMEVFMPHLIRAWLATTSCRWPPAHQAAKPLFMRAGAA